MVKLRSMLAILLVFMGYVGHAQQKTITGTVYDAENQPLSGASVAVRGTNVNTLTNEAGQYSIVAATGQVLVFSYVGFQSEERTVDQSNTVNVTMAAAFSDLDEVVVVGYGTTSRAYLTGNVASVKSEDIANVPVPNFTQALQGRMSGVFVESSSGKVGEGVKVRIRGTTSVSGGNSPLYVIDGIPMTTSGTLGYSNPLTDINPNDIETFEVLKDASAAAIYGARGANGVVLITTKSGAAGRTKINASFQRGYSDPTRLKEWLNAEEYVELFLEAGENVDDREFVENRLNQYSGHSDWRTGETDTDWQDQAFNSDAGMHIVNLSATGGNEKTQFYFGGTLDKTKGILIRNDLEKISGRLNLTHHASDYFTLGANFALTRIETNRLPGDNAFSNPIQLVALAPITPVRDLNGELYDRPTTTYYNNLVDSENAQWGITSFRNISNAFGELKLSKNFKLRSEFGIDLLTQNQEQFFGSRTQSGESTDGYAASAWTRIFNYTTNNYLTYNTVVNDVHYIEAVGGMSFQKSAINYTNVTGEQFPTDDLRTIASAADITGGSSTLNDFSFLSYFARANYRFADKYLFTLSGRFDGSSRFGQNNKYGFFPAASAGWIVSGEDFFENNVMNFLKLKASYGLTGNAEIGNYDSFGLYGATSYGQEAGLSPSQIPNPDLEWEKTAQFDAGIEFGFFNNRLSGEVDYYHKATTDLLLNVPVPSTSGYLEQTQNIGEMSNKGVEVTLNGAIVQTDGFQWNSSINFARNVNRVEALGGGDILTPNSRFLNSVIVGQPIGVFYGAAYVGADPANGDALWYADEARTTTTNDHNAAARVVLGNPNPDWIAGFNNSFAYKGIDLSFLFQSVYGNQIYEGGGGYYAAAGDWFDNQSRDQLRRWQNPNDITDVPQARLGEGNGTQASSRYMSDGSYLRLKTLTIGYNFPTAWLQRLKVSSARVFLVGQNLLTFTDYKGWDPEVNTDYLGADNQSTNLYQGNDFYSAPQARTFSFGVNIGF